jgi:TetR/AcrR family transcriptional regulator
MVALLWRKGQSPRMVEIINKPRPGPVPGSSRGDTRDDILRLAEAIFANVGFAGASLDMIAQAVGIRRPSVLHHFRSKREIYDVVEREIFVSLAGNVDRLITTGQPIDRLIGLLDAWLDFMIERPSAARIINRNMADLISRAVDPVEFADPVISRFERIVEDGKAIGEFKPVNAMLTLNILGGGIINYVINASQYGDTRRYKIDDEILIREFRLMLHDTARGLFTRPTVSA